MQLQLNHYKALFMHATMQLRQQQQDEQREMQFVPMNTPVHIHTLIGVGEYWTNVLLRRPLLVLEVAPALAAST